MKIIQIRKYGVVHDGSVNELVGTVLRGVGKLIRRTARQIKYGKYIKQARKEVKAVKTGCLAKCANIKLEKVKCKTSCNSKFVRKDRGICDKKFKNKRGKDVAKQLRVCLKTIKKENRAAKKVLRACLGNCHEKGDTATCVLKCEKKIRGAKTRLKRLKWG